MSKPLFYIAFMLLGYDWLGHFLVTSAYILEFKNPSLAAYLWNTYSVYVWPRITNPLLHELRWTIQHGLTLVLFALAYRSKL